MARLWRNVAYAALVVVGTSSPSRVFADGPRDRALVRVAAEHSEAVDALRQHGAEPWTETPRPGGTMLFDVPRAALPELMAAGFDVHVVVPDLAPVIASERERIDRALQLETSFYEEYRDQAAIEAKLLEVAELHPDRVELLELGTSLERRPIRGLRLRAASDDAPVLLIQAGQHAREWIAVMSGVCMAERLAEVEEGELRTLLDAVEVVIVPLVNPDGFVYTWTDERLWRKNRRDGVGVDTNRNFEFGWGGEGSSDVPEDGNYRGLEPFSEPEAAMIRDYVLGEPRLAGHVDLHSFGQLVLYPWHNAIDEAPAIEPFRSMAEEIAAAMTAAHGVEYTPLQGAQLYPAGGAAPDWTYAEFGSYSITIELRPREDGEENPGFILPPEQILEVCDETMAAVEVLLDWTATADPLEPGNQGGNDSGTDSSGGESSSGDVSTSDSGGTSGESGEASTSSSTTPSSSSSTSGPGESSSGDGAPADGADDGCGCTHRTSGVGPWLLLAPALFGRRRRRTA